jgi:omega-6 fatty acid desaturase (delta-12 desaturase)
LSTNETDAAPTPDSNDQAGAIVPHKTPLRETYGDDTARRVLRRSLAGFQTPVLFSSLSQILTSIGGYLGVCAAMYATAGISFWFVLALVPFAAGFLVRTFIIQHDCGHGAFFRSRRANNILGVVCSLLTLAPYASWRSQHAGHHGVWNNLDRRDTGVDIYSTCLTVDEYRALGPRQRRWFRISRSPAFANLVLPPLVFLVLYRLPFDMPTGWRRERIGVYLTNLALVIVYGGVSLVLGFKLLAIVQLPTMVLASIIGVWLFTVQHRSENTLWARESEWDALKASLEATNYLRMPRLLQWFTGNIGLHHIHHLNPRIPNYRLQACHNSVGIVGDVPAITPGAAFRAMFYVLWDERRRRMVTIRDAHLGGLPRAPECI